MVNIGSRDMQGGKQNGVNPRRDDAPQAPVPSQPTATPSESGVNRNAATVANNSTQQSQTGQDSAPSAPPKDVTKVKEQSVKSPTSPKRKYADGEESPKSPKKSKLRGEAEPFVPKRSIVPKGARRATTQGSLRPFEAGNPAGEVRRHSEHVAGSHSSNNADQRNEGEAEQAQEQPQQAGDEQAAEPVQQMPSPPPTPPLRPRPAPIVPAAGARVPDPIRPPFSPAPFSPYDPRQCGHHERCAVRPPFRYTCCTCGRKVCEIHKGYCTKFGEQTGARVNHPHGGR